MVARRSSSALGAFKACTSPPRSSRYPGLPSSHTTRLIRPLPTDHNSLKASSTVHRATKAFENAHQDRTLRLYDGRTLSYAIYGPCDGRPVFFFHGLPSCRLEAAGLSSSGILKDAGVKLIAPDRPGFGQSTPAPGRTILGYADDVEALADHLGLNRDGKSGLGDGVSESDEKADHGGYGIVGGSGGGPYALACARVASQQTHRFPNLRKVGVFAGAPPFVPPISLPALLDTATRSGNIDTSTRRQITLRHEADTRELQRDWMVKSKLMFGLAERFPKLSRTISSAGLNTSSWMYRSPRGRKTIERYLSAWLQTMAENTKKQNSPNDIPAKAGLDKTPEASESDAILHREVESLVALARETWAQGPDGWVDEAGLLGRPWGFDPSQIRCSPRDGAPGMPLKIWHGSRDDNAPLTSMRWLVDRIPDAELVVLEDKGHFELGDSLKEMLHWASSPE